MATLTTNLYLGAAGLAAQSKGLEVTGRNLNNVNTPGYSRQRVDLSSGATFVGPNGPETSGVTINGVSQSRNALLDRQVQSDASLTAGLTAKQDIYQQVQTALGQGINTSGSTTGVSNPDASTGGINGGLNDFFTAMQALSANPSDPTAKSVAVQAATALVTQINTADQKLSTVQTDATTQIGSDVASVNQLLKDVAGLNDQITKSEATSPGGALDLRDQRQAKIEQLSAYMNVETRPDPAGNGSLQVFSRDGSGNEVPLVNRSAVVSNVTFDGTSFSAGSPPSTLALTSGSLTEELKARDGFTQSVRDSLGNFATQLRQAVNAAANPGGTGQDIFAAGSGGALIATASGLSQTTLQSGSTGDAGANDLANAVSGVASQKFSTAGGDSIDGTLGGSFAGTVATVGNALKTASSDLEDQQLAQQVTVAQRDQVTGVSLDEETTNLMMYQRAYQASARYITTIDSMLDTVVNQMGTTH